MEIGLVEPVMAAVDPLRLAVVGVAAMETGLVEPVMGKGVADQRARERLRLQWRPAWLSR